MEKGNCIVVIIYQISPLSGTLLYHKGTYQLTQIILTRSTTSIQFRSYRPTHSPLFRQPTHPANPHPLSLPSVLHSQTHQLAPHEALFSPQSVDLSTGVQPDAREHLDLVDVVRSTGFCLGTRIHFLIVPEPSGLYGARSPKSPDKT